MLLREWGAIPLPCRRMGFLTRLWRFTDGLENQSYDQAVGRAPPVVLTLENMNVAFGNRVGRGHRPAEFHFPLGTLVAVQMFFTRLDPFQLPVGAHLEPVERPLVGFFTNAHDY